MMLLGSRANGRILNTRSVHVSGGEQMEYVESTLAISALCFTP